MDFNNFVMENFEKYGLSDEDWGPLAKCAIVRFDYDEKQNVSGTYNGMFVYRDYNSNTILPGDIWICSLTLNPKTHSNYFAKPMQKIDASFLFQLNQEQKEEIANAIWETNKDAMMPMMEDKFRDIIDTRVNDAIAKTKAEKETEINELNEKNAELEKKSAEDKQIIDSLQLQIDGLKTRAGKEISAVSATPAVMETQNPFQLERPVVERIDADKIRSDAFTKSRYFVHLSSDSRIIVVTPSDKGNVVCVDNTIALNGLSFISNFSEPREMPAQYNPEYGGILVYL